MILPFVAASFAADVRPIHQLPGPCSDRRYPAVFGEWVVGCGANGRIDRALSMKTGEVIRFPGSAETVGFGFWAVFGRKGVFRWKTQQMDQSIRIVNALVAPSFNGLDRIASLEEKRVRLRIGSQSWTVAANPRGWYPPAILGDQVIWVNDDGKGGSDLWSWVPGSEPKVYAGGEDHQRHVVSSETHVAYLDADQIVVRNVQEGTVEKVSVTVVDRISIWDKTVCWSAWHVKDIDIFCSDGFHLNRPGHQLWPSHSNHGIVFQESGLTMMVKRIE